MLRVGEQVVAVEDSELYGDRARGVAAGSIGVVIARHGLFARSVSVRYGNGLELFQPARKLRPLPPSTSGRG